MSEDDAAKVFSHLGIDPVAIESGDEAAGRQWMLFFERPDMLTILAGLGVTMNHYSVWIPEGDYGDEILDEDR